MSENNFKITHNMLSVRRYAPYTLERPRKPTTTPMQFIDSKESYILKTTLPGVLRDAPDLSRSSIILQDDCDQQIRLGFQDLKQNQCIKSTLNRNNNLKEFILKTVSLVLVSRSSKLIKFETIHFTVQGAVSVKLGSILNASLFGGCLSIVIPKHTAASEASQSAQNQ